MILCDVGGGEDLGTVTLGSLSNYNYNDEDMISSNDDVDDGNVEVLTNSNDENTECDDDGNDNDDDRKEFWLSSVMMMTRKL